MLYEIDGARHKPERVLEDRLKQGNTPAWVASYTRELVEGIVEHKAEIDNIIATHAPEWPLMQMATVDRNLLRIAIYEITEEKKKTPPKVAIDEAVELAQIFGSYSSSRFVNGVLGSVMDTIAAQEAKDLQAAES